MSTEQVAAPLIEECAVTRQAVVGGRGVQGIVRDIDGRRPPRYDKVINVLLVLREDR